jgi:hypothetical protein
VPPEALRPNACRLDWRRVVEIADGHERADRKAPAPAFSFRIVLRVAHDLDDGEDRLPHRGVEDR